VTQARLHHLRCPGQAFGLRECRAPSLGAGRALGAETLACVVERLPVARRERIARRFAARFADRVRGGREFDRVLVGAEVR
jgi:hypothetical protein